ncbi:MAG: ABC transporter ATP-binding protein [Methanomicrobiales archaeon]|nr:ABC transporter ATP-binding protein [Methanomicrobiales archaeon]
MILEIDDLSFSYDRKRIVLNDICTEVKKGEVLSILGRNGIGKSTLIKCIINLYQNYQGDIRIMGDNIKDLSAVEAAMRMGYVSQGSQMIFPYSVLDFVLMGRSPHIPMFESPSTKDIGIAESVIEKMGLSHLKDRPVNEISGGERQMAMIARALTQEPKMLILDEPTSHLDFANQINVLKAIKNLADDGMSIVMSTHFPDHGFLISDNVAIMQDGTFVAQGPADEVITKENLRAAYGVDVMIKYVAEVGRNVCIPYHIGGSGMML